MSVFDDERDLLLGPFGKKRNKPKPKPGLTVKQKKAKSATVNNSYQKSATTPATMSVTPKVARTSESDPIVQNLRNTMEKLIENCFMEDWQANIEFPYTGKANIIGMTYPDSCFVNDRTGKYFRFAVITFDSSMQPTDQTVVDEEFEIMMANSESSHYVSESCTVRLQTHITGKRVTRDKCKCIVTPDMNYLTIPEIYVTEESENDTYQIGLWIRSEFSRLICITHKSSRANNSTPLNTPYVTSGYYVNIPTGDDIVYGVDVIDESASITLNQVCRGINLFEDIHKRFMQIESIRYPDFKAASINTDMAWVPNTDEGESSVGYQRIPLISADYAASLSDSFIKIEPGPTHAFRVSDDGLYQMQIVSRFNMKSAVEDADITLALFKDDEEINAARMDFKLRADNGVYYMNPTGIGGATVTAYLKSTDLVRLQLKFNGKAISGVINEGTQIQVTKLVDIPAE